MNTFWFASGAWQTWPHDRRWWIHVAPQRAPGGTMKAEQVFFLVKNRSVTGRLRMPIDVLDHEE